MSGLETLNAIMALPVVTPFLELCRAQDVSPVLVGGAVRDALRGLGISSDLDWVVPCGQSETLSQQLAEALGGKALCLDADFGIYRVIADKGAWTLDLADQVGPSIQTDLGRRDLTINAIGYDPLEQAILDPYNGQGDLAAGVIRMVSESNLVEDPLRLLRVFRFAAELGFETITPDTLSAVSTHKEALLRSAVERIGYEWLRMLSAPQCAHAVLAMARTGLLEVLFPELSAMHPVPANLYHHLPLFEHTLELLVQLEAHFGDFPDTMQARLNEPFHPGASHLALVRLACLFHDAGKPATMAYDAETDRYRFYGHESVSAQITEGIGERMKWGKPLTEVVCLLVATHLYPGDMLKPEVSAKAHQRFYRRTHPWLAEVLALAVADRFSAKGPAVTLTDLTANKAGLIALWNQYELIEESQKPGQVLLKGRDLIEAFGLSPGPHLGTLLRHVDTAYLNGDISTRDEALTLLATVLATPSGTLPSET